MEVDILYKREIEETVKRKFNANDIKSFIHKIFSMYECSGPLMVNKKVVASDFYPMITEDIYIQFPDTVIHNREEFAAWHKKIHSELNSDIHTVNKINVVFLENGKYQASFYVNWRALYQDGRFINQTLRQIWTIIEEENNQSPVLEKNIVKSADILEG